MSIKLKKIVYFWTIFMLMQIVFAGNFWVWAYASILPPVAHFLIHSAISFVIAYKFAKFVVAQYNAKGINININNIWSRFLKFKAKALIFCSIFILALLPYSFSISGIILPKEGQSSTANLKVFNWNTYFWENREDEDDFLAKIASYNANVYQLQEVISPDRRDVDMETVQENFAEYEIYRYGELLTITNLPVENILYNADGNFLRIDVNVDGTVVSMYNVHMPVHIYPTFIDALNLHNLRALGFAELEEDISLNQNRIVVSGDFNSTTTMRVMDNFFKNYTNAFEYSGSIYPATWQILGISLWQIDYFFVSRNIKVQSLENINLREYSDHWAQFVELDV